MPSAVPPDMTEEQLNRLEDSCAEGYQYSLEEKLEANAKLCSLLAQLIKKNPNVALDLSFFMGSCQFPPRFLGKEGSVQKEGTLIASVSLRQGSAELYWPSSTNSIHVARIETWEGGVTVKLFDFGAARYILEGAECERIIQKAAFTRMPRKLTGLSIDEVQIIFNQVVADITEVFQEYID